MGAGASKPAGARPAFGLRPRFSRGPKRSQRDGGQAPVLAPAAATRTDPAAGAGGAAPAALRPQQQHQHATAADAAATTDDAAADVADAAAYARTCAALERVLAEGARAGRGHLARGRGGGASAPPPPPPPPPRYSAAAAHAAERRSACALNASAGLLPAADEDDNADAVSPEAEAVARAALGMPDRAGERGGEGAGGDDDGLLLPQRCYWAGPPVPGCEPERLQAMEAYGLLADTALPALEDDEEDEQAAAEGADGQDNNKTKPKAAAAAATATATADGAASSSLRPAIDSALKLVRGVFGVDEALVALFGDRRVYIRDTTGGFSRGDFPWRFSFCYWTLAPPTPTALVVRDVRTDARFSANSIARRAGVRFYCGVPLLAPGGHRLGVLCFASREPRPDFDAASVALAGNLAELVARELAREARLAVARRVSAAARLRLRDMGEASAPVLLVERVAGAAGGQGGGGRWVVRHANGAWIDLVARARRARRVRSGPVEVGGGGGADAEEGRKLADGDPFGGALGADLFGDVFERPPQPQPLLQPPPPPPSPPAPFLIPAAAPAASSIPGDSATSLPTMRFGGGGGAAFGGGGRDAAKTHNDKAALLLPPPPPLAADGGSNEAAAEDDDERLFSQQAPFSVHGARLRPAPFGRRGRRTRCGPSAAAATTTAPAAASLPLPPARAVTLRFIPAAAPGAVGLPLGAQLTAAPAWLPDEPVQESQRRRLAALWFVDVEEPEPPLSSSAAAAPHTHLQPQPQSESPPPPSSATPPLPSSRGTAAEAARPGTFFPEGLHPPALLRPSPTAPPSSYPPSDSSVGGGGGACPCQQPQQQPQLPPSLAGLVLGAPLACGSYGRVFRGRFRGDERVAVKVLDPQDVARADAETGAALEATLGERLRHPNVVQTLAWGVVEAGSAAALPPKERVWTRRRSWQQQGQQQGQRQQRRPRRLSAGDVGGGGSGSVRGSVEIGGGSGGRGSGGGGGGGHSGNSSSHHNNPFAQAAKKQAIRHGQALSGGDDDDDYDDYDDNEEEQVPEEGGATAPSSSSAASSGPLPLVLPPPQKQQHHPPPPPKQTWLVLEYCDRGCLQDAVDGGWLRTGRDPRSGAPHLPAILATAREVAAGMAHLHREGVVHGDLSAFNVLLASGGGGGGCVGGGGDPAALGERGWTAKIADFGLARAGGGAGAVITTRTYGTVTHQAPEVLRDGSLSAAADVYAFGTCLWQMWTAARPWRGLSHAQVVRAVAIEGKALAWPDDAPQGLAALGEACLSPDPEERPTFADVLEVLDPLVDVLEACVGGEETSAASAGAG